MADKSKPEDGEGAEPKPEPLPDDVPDVVLEELLAAFSDDDAEAIDFDDPAIDRMLGLDDSSDDDDDTTRPLRPTAPTRARLQPPLPSTRPAR